MEQELLEEELLVEAWEEWEEWELVEVILVLAGDRTRHRKTTWKMKHLRFQPLQIIITFK